MSEVPSGAAAGSVPVSQVSGDVAANHAPGHVGAGPGRANQASVGEILASQAPADQMVANEAAVHQASAGQGVSSRVVGDQVVRPARSRLRAGRASDAGNAAEKTIRLLEAAVAPGGPHLLGDIAGAAGVPKASAHRILQTLVGNGFLSSDGAGRYPLGPRLRTLAAGVTAAQAEARIDDLLTDLSLRTGQTVHLALRTGNTATYTHKVDSANAVQMASRVGMRMPLHTTAIGKCVLAGLPEPELASIIAATGLPARTPASLTTPLAVRAELARVRATGFAVDDEENEASIRCVAAGVRDPRGNVIGGVSVSTLTFLVPRERMLGWAGEVVAAADSVSTRLA